MICLTRPEGPLKGSIRLAGSKSISNRLLVLRHILRAETALLNLSDAEDTSLLSKAINRISGSSAQTINVNHAGTALRFLTALLACTPGERILTGSERLRSRPIAPLVEALRMLGADIAYAEKPGYAPLLIRGKLLPGGEVKIDSGISSQFISALMLIAPSLKNGIRIQTEGTTVSEGYITMTAGILKEFGLSCSLEGKTISVAGEQQAKVPPTLTVESDWSSASYWYSFCALAQEAKISLSSCNLKSIQPDSVAADIFRQLGVRTQYSEGTILLSRTNECSKEFSYDFTGCPDIALTVAVTCIGLGVPAHLKGLQTLQYKESERVSALATELRKVGAEVVAGDDFIRISGKPDTARIAASTIETYNDHRMAMSFAPLCMVAPHVNIGQPEVVAKSYTRFWEHLKSVGFTVNSHP